MMKCGHSWLEKAHTTPLDSCSALADTEQVFCLPSTSVLQSRSWNKRWFALAGDTLSYSDSPREKTPSGVFKVANLKDILKSSDQVFEVLPL
jgi:hypothetical protein